MAEDKKENQSMQVNINLDTTPIMYTDNVMMVMNEDGVVMEICQRVGNTNQVRIVARVGMSHNQAKKLVKQLGDLLLMQSGKMQTGGKVN